MNLKQIRLLRNFFQMCMDFLKKHPDAKLPDQDALNFICFSHVLYLEKNIIYILENTRFSGR